MVGNPIFGDTKGGIVFDFSGVVVLPIAADDFGDEFDAGAEGDDGVALPEGFEVIPSDWTGKY
jgi:hypothetical protein